MVDLDPKSRGAELVEKSGVALGAASRLADLAGCLSADLARCQLAASTGFPEDLRLAEHSWKRAWEQMDGLEAALERVREALG